MQFIISIFQNVASIGIVILPLLIPQVREFIIKKFQHSLDKALEDRKTLNDRKNYISKVRFDKEFEMYQELSENSYNGL